MILLQFVSQIKHQIQFGNVLVKQNQIIHHKLLHNQLHKLQKRGGLNQPEQQSQTGTSINTKHKNTITGLNAWRKSEQGNVTEFVTCALDGKILFWKVSDLEKTLNGFKTL